MKNLLFLLLLTIVAVGCDVSESEGSNLDDSFKWVIDSMKTQGYNTTEECDPPPGISDTLILGYTDRTQGVFQDKILELKKLKISGLGFEKKEERWTKIVRYYRFDFDSAEEKKKFEDFQYFCSQYQTHGKNQVRFIQKDLTWFLEFRPMP